jgi:hypothetical protein
MGPKLNALLNVAGFCMVLAVNALANILPINGTIPVRSQGFTPTSLYPQALLLAFGASFIFFL